MKKMTFLAALLGVTHFSNAQVGIGTATPADAAQLEISAINKGVLIPRVELRDTTDFGPVTGTEVESLLVYNTETIADVTPGFYYWVKESATTPHWERIVNQTQLDEAIQNITDLQGDITKIKELLNFVYPSNDLGDSTLTDDSQGGGMIFTPADGTTPAKIEYVYFDGTNYITKDITADIIDLIKGNETKTKIVTINNVQYYVSESYTGTADPTTGTETGVFKIDVVGGVINNIEEIFTTNTTIVINEGLTNEQTFTTVEEYIQYISENAIQDGVTKIEIDATTNQASFLTWDATTQTWVSVANTSFSNIVKANETVTTITENADGTYTYKNEAGADVVIDIPASVIENLGDIIESVTTFNNSSATTLVEYIQNMIENSDLPAGTVTAEIVNGNVVFSIIDANGVSTVVPTTAFNNIVKANQSLTDIARTNVANVINYVYTAEPTLNGTARTFTINLTQDLINQITNNEDVKNAITNLTLGNGGVYYNGTGADLTVGTTVIPADSLYIIDEDGNGEAIDLGGIVVKEVIENFNTIVNSPVIVNNKSYDSVEEYIQYLIETSDANVGYTVGGIDAADNDGVAIPANSFYYIDQSTGNKVAIDLEAIVKANETVTTITKNAGGTYTYKNEAGADVVIDIPASVIENLGGIIEGTTTFNNSSATTLVEYIQNMINNSDLPAGTVTAEIVNGNVVFSIIDANGVSTVVPTTAFNSIVKANETETTIDKNTSGTATAGDVEITYDYFNETSGSTAQATIDLTTDIQNLIEGNTDIQNAITNILNQGGNVYYGDHDDNAATPNVFYTIVNEVKTPIDISEVVVNAITNATTVQKQEIKNQLGDNFQNATVVNTGDTWIDGGKIYRGIFDATVTGGSANVSAITLTGGTIGNVIGIKILNATTNQIINTATTDVAVTTGSLTFRIGTGNMYNVLSDSNLAIKVIVEYSVTTP